MQSSTAESIITVDDRDGALKQVLARFAADASCLLAEKQDAFEGRADLMHSLLREIDETILPRQLTLYFDQRAVAELTVSHRRLLSLDLSGVSSPAGNQTSIAQIYAQRLRQLVLSNKGAGFRITRQPCEISAESESCSARLLMETLTTQQDQGRLRSLMSSIGTDAEAWVFQDGSTAKTESFGPDDQIQRLTDLANSDAVARQKRRPTPQVPDQAPSCMVLTMSPNMRVIVACDRNEILLLTLSVQNLDAALQAWRSIFAQS
ncbi:hypothetical protein A9Q94_08825 [Rhodobacterales bacterium 56_14_T64]|nr:hypothetical protein A9Q94_08825 [Rhodobacterales bacterium 56_14_T64]